MSTSVERDTWVLRVLGVAIASTAARDQSAATRQEPFQIFVKSVDGITLTLSLISGPATTLGELQDMVEGRTGLSLDEHALMIGTKPFNTTHAKFPVSEYGVQRNQTMFLQGALKGGFGERAAMADAILRDIQHGNVLGDIEVSDGVSKAKVEFGRKLLNPDLSIGQDFRAALFEKLRDRGVLPHGVSSDAELKDWMKSNEVFLSAISSSHLHAGNCGEYADVAYTSLLSKTKNQTIYRASMVKGYDHGFAITCPTDHRGDIDKLCADSEAMVVDPWWGSRICTLKAFVDGKNPYGKPIVPGENLKIRLSAKADGRPPLSEDFEETMKEVLTVFIEDSQVAIDYDARIDKEKADQLADASKNVRNLKALADAIELRMSSMPVGTAEELAAVAIAEKELTAAVDRLESAKKELQEAMKAMPGIFGESGAIWNRTNVRDKRKHEDIMGVFDRAYERGGSTQLEAEMEYASDDEFLSYLADDADKVLSSEKLGRRFQKSFTALADLDFLAVCGAMKAEYFTKYVSGDLLERCAALLPMKYSIERGRDDRW